MRKYYDFANDLSGGDSGEQQQVTGDIKKELILNKHVPCTCNDGFKSRLLADPDCPRCSYGDEIMDAMTEYAASQPPTPEPAGELYWKQRCLAAEAVINWEDEPSTIPQGVQVYNKWNELKNQEVEPQQNQDE